VALAENEASEQARASDKPHYLPAKPVTLCQLVGGQITRVASPTPIPRRAT